MEEVYCLEGWRGFFGRIVSMWFLRFYLLFKTHVPFKLIWLGFYKKKVQFLIFMNFTIVSNAGFEFLRIQSVDE